MQRLLPHIDKELSINGLSSIQINNTIHLYGGLQNQNHVFSLDNSNLSLHAQKTSTQSTLFFSPSIAFSNGFLVFGTGTSNISLAYFDLTNLSWSNSIKNMDPPLDRRYHTVVQHGTDAYLYGGVNNGTLQNDLYVFSLIDFNWRKIMTVSGRTGHTASMLSNGLMVIIGGKNSIELAPMHDILAYDTLRTKWLDPPLVQGEIPLPRIHHSAVIINGSSIFICGGQDDKAPPFQNYLTNNAILDTTQWRWSETNPKAQPFPQSFGALHVVNDTNVIYGYGTNYQSLLDQFFVFDTINGSWLYETPKEERSFLWIIVLSVVIAILCTYVVSLVVLGKKLNLMMRNLMQSMKSELWKPRVGEPGWAETFRLVLKAFFFGLFLYLFLILATQVANSPIIDQLSYEANETIHAPDILFCFDGYNESTTPFVRCSTDFGVPCSDYFKQIDNRCSLFTTTELRIGSTFSRQVSHGSIMTFDYYSQGGSLQVSFFNQKANYSIDALVKKQYLIKPGIVHTITYELIKRLSLDPNIWNYVGVASKKDDLYEIQTDITSESFKTEYASGGEPTGTLYVLPRTCQTKVLSEQRAFTIMNATGVFGGLFGLLFSLQSCLFGHRPRSPWGYMHRWSFGQFRNSLLRGLQTNFFPEPKMPNNTNDATVRHESHHSIHNIHQQLRINTQNLSSLDPILLPPTPMDTVRFSGLSEGEIRIRLVEERIHLLERLFQAYYIDDEIFRSLDHALHK
ncbi:galactose oxidase [Backusella circina FSU 941]|nr:galactose oxidase [Backusella circina FSU 941]